MQGKSRCNDNYCLWTGDFPKQNTNNLQTRIK